MKHLNKTATEIFSRLLNKLGNRRHRTFELNTGIPLIVEMLNEYIRTPYGEAKLYSIGHYIQTTGGIYPEPEIQLIVIDHRQSLNNPEALFIIPHLYQKYSEGTYTESTVLQDDFLCSVYPEFLEAHTTLAENWLVQLDEECLFD